MSIVTSSCLSISLRLMVICQDSLVVLVDNILRYAFHAKDLDVQTCSIRKSIVNGSEVFLVDLAHVDAEASCGIQSSTTSFAFEMLCLLMRYENLKVIEIALAVVTPWSRKNLLYIRMTALLPGHFRDGLEVGRRLVRTRTA